MISDSNIREAEGGGVSVIHTVIAFPASLSIHSLIRKSESVVWRGTNTVDLPYEISKLSNCGKLLRIHKNQNRTRVFSNVEEVIQSDQYRDSRKGQRADLSI